MANLKIKKNDTVMVIAGKDSGKTGIVTSVDPKSQRVIIDGLNQVKKHRKAKTQQEVSEIITKSAPIHISNVMLIDPETAKPTRVSIKIEEKDGKKVKVRVSKKSGTVIETVNDFKKKAVAKKAEKVSNSAATPKKKKAVKKSAKTEE